MDNPENDQVLIEIIRANLNLSDSAVVIKEPIFKNAWSPIEVDLVIEDNAIKYFIEIKSKVRVDSIARLVLLKELLQKQQKDIAKISLVIASKIIPPIVEEIANQIGIKLVPIPHNIGLTTHQYDYFPNKIKITSEKSWKVITRLLKEGMTSIRQLSLLEKVSYGWAYSTIQSLISQGIVTKKGNYVGVSDINKLLNGVGWERPFENLFVGEINIEYDDAFKAAQNLTYMLKNKGIKFAFTSYTAGGLYTGYVIRHDSVYLYIEKKEIDFFMKTFKADKQGIKARVYVPDRDVFYDVREKDSVQVVSTGQTLLDLAGLGYSGRDITKSLVDKYASI
jgi:hypothetical protein